MTIFHHFFRNFFELFENFWNSVQTYKRVQIWVQKMTKNRRFFVVFEPVFLCPTPFLITIFETKKNVWKISSIFRNYRKHYLWDFKVEKFLKIFWNFHHFSKNCWKSANVQKIPCLEKVENWKFQSTRLAIGNKFSSFDKFWKLFKNLQKVVKIWNFNIGVHSKFWKITILDNFGTFQNRFKNWSWLFLGLFLKISSKWWKF